MHGPLGRMQRQAEARREREAGSGALGGGALGVGAARQVASAYLRKGRELYVRSDALAVTDRGGGAVLEVDMAAVRSAIAPDARTVRVTWAAGRGGRGEGAPAAEGGGGMRGSVRLPDCRAAIAESIRRT